MHYLVQQTIQLWLYGLCEVPQTKKAAPGLRAAVERGRLTYCTVRAIVVVCMRVPEVAVTVTIWTPFGVPGELGVVGAEVIVGGAAVIELEQPTTRPVEARRSTTRPRSCIGFPLPMVRLREKIRIEPKGIRNATANMDAPLPHGLCCWRCAMLAAV